MPRKESAQISEIRGEFHRRLTAITQLTSQAGRDEAWRLNGIGITQVKFRAPVCVYSFESEKHFDYPRLEIWVEDPKNITDHRQPHWEARDHLGDFAKAKGFNFGQLPVSGYIFQDNSNRLLLSVDHYTAQDLAKGIQSDEWKRKGWSNLIENYGLAMIFGNIPYDEVYQKDGFTHSVHGVTVTNVLDYDLVGQIREDNFLRDFARRYQMTNWQFMRFRLLTSGAKDAKISTNYEQLVQELLAEDEELKRTDGFNYSSLT